MAFAQLTYRESLRDIEVNLRAQAHRLYRMGFRCTTISRNTLANANVTRPWQIYADFAQHLIAMARPLYANEPMGIDLDATVYAFDATTIDLRLSVYPWAPFRSAKAAIRLHTLLDLRGSIPSFIHITDGKTHEVNVLDELSIEPGAFYLMDRGYLDFARLYNMHEKNAFFVTRAKSNTKFKRRYSHPVDRAATNIVCDQICVLAILQLSKEKVPNVFDQQLHAQARADRCTLQVTLASRIVLQMGQTTSAYQSFFGTSENAVKTQIWIAVATYVLIAIVKKRLYLSHSLYEILQILSLTMFETTPINQLLTPHSEKLKCENQPIQMSLF